MISNLSIKNKLMLLVIIPLIIVVLSTAKLLHSSYSRVTELNALDKIVILSTKIGALVHETQKERGMTAGFVGSKGKKFVEKLPKQRKLVDSKRKDFFNELKIVDINSYSKEFASNMDLMINKLDKLDALRNKVSSLDIKGSDAIAFYTNFNALSLNAISSITKLSNDAEVSQDLVSYMNFLLSKERAGVERAVLTNTFARDNFSNGMKEKFFTLVAQQNAYMDSFLKVARDNAASFYKKTLQGEAVIEVSKMRRIAAEKNDTFGIDASYWFSQITSKINLLKKVENFLSDSLIKTITKQYNSAKTNMIIFGSMGLLGIFITILFARVILNKIIKDVESLKVGLDNFFSFINFEKTDIKEINIDSNDELGLMAKQIDKNIIKTKENFALDKELILNTMSVTNEINKGNLDNKISVNSNNPALNELKEIINQMISTLNINLNNIIKVLDSYSNLDYRAKLETSNFEGTIKKLESNVNILRDSITKMLVENKNDGLVLNENSEILSTNMRDISNAANTQAASLEETAASLEEITSNMTNSTQTVQKMAEYGKRVKESVGLGEELANNTSSSMIAINNETTSISDAITVIDQIAFQTNILSLNAAVEAATAGEAGKGFAVVAQEVRNLARRSAEAAKEIKQLVENAQEKANDGKNIADKMIDGYKQLNENITYTLELINDVNASSKEQTTGIVQINDAINNLDQITQQNAQNASSADRIAQKTKEISNIIVANVNAKEFDGKS
ncbi:methyl-accepting chemotaxis protein [Poseidonibacter ostreae]|uniref:Chemotaxis protein n=1 Tax=Poseidonibacter ostreae TaxID=2654171 RepID=A0ABQ6VPW9_9BACT|nr:methyl-accepting chemotaxis protein [Poseidonibacter ostreae]KAB7892591.1 chemotaxis protein [Poseidonibacter ostreae]